MAGLGCSGHEGDASRAVVIRLPLILRRPKHRATYALVWLPYILVYQAINRFPLYPPVELPRTSLDHAIPFLPALLPLYVAYIPLFWWTGARSEDDETATRFFYATHLQLLLCAAIWLAYPVTMPRAEFYSASVYGWADQFWRWFDAPNNCLPSLHAANGLMFIRFNWGRPAHGLHTALALGVIVSTVLVKQHYVVDVVAGGLVYAVAAWFLRDLDVGPGRIAACGYLAEGEALPQPPPPGVATTMRSPASSVSELFESMRRRRPLRLTTSSAPGFPSSPPASPQAPRRRLSASSVTSLSTSTSTSRTMPSPPRCRPLPPDPRRTP